MLSVGLLVVLGVVLYLTGTRVMIDEDMTHAGQARELAALHKELLAMQATRPARPQDAAGTPWMAKIEKILVRIGNISSRAMRTEYELSSGGQQLEEATKQTFWTLKKIFPMPEWGKHRAWAAEIIVYESAREPE